MEVIISERETPIGKIVPFPFEKKREEWKMIGPRKPFRELAKKRFNLPKVDLDVVQTLLEERRKR